MAQDISLGGSDVSSHCADSGSPPESREAVNKADSWISDVDKARTDDPNENAGDPEVAERFLKLPFISQ